MRTRIISEPQERPIPNFYNLAGQSSKVDIVVKDGEVVTLEDGMAIRVIGTSGHSVDEVSYILEDSAFIGDTVPIKNDIPIYISAADTLKSLDKIAGFKNINYYYPAWNKTYSKREMSHKLKEAYEIVETIERIISSADSQIKSTIFNNEYQLTE